jgi:hypothetical protein
MSISQPWLPSLDRTEWKFGECVFNILMLGIIQEGAAFPVAWTLLDTSNSNSHEPMERFNDFLERFRDRKIASLSADREFVGKDWFAYLLDDPNTPFRIRICSNHTLSDGHASLKVGILFQDLQVGQQKVLRRKQRLWRYWPYIAALRLEDGDLLVIATQSAPKSAIADYAQRWRIETLLGIFKTRGFCLESTHLTEPERLNKLIALLSLVLCWVVLTGEWLHHAKPLKVKTHSRRAKSIFRYGFDYLRNIVVNLNEKMDDLINVLQFLSCT